MNENSPKIALIEDDADLLEMFKLKLKLEGFKTVMAKDGALALKLIQNEMPDLVLLDMLLPNKDGFEVLKTIKNSLKEGLKNTTFVIPALICIRINSGGLSAGGESSKLVLEKWG